MFSSIATSNTTLRTLKFLVEPGLYISIKRMLLYFLSSVENMQGNIGHKLLDTSNLIQTVLLRCAYSNEVRSTTLYSDIVPTSYGFILGMHYCYI